MTIRGQQGACRADRHCAFASSDATFWTNGNFESYVTKDKHNLVLSMTVAGRNRLPTRPAPMTFIVEFQYYLKKRHAAVRFIHLRFTCSPRYAIRAYFRRRTPALHPALPGRWS